MNGLKIASIFVLLALFSFCTSQKSPLPVNQPQYGGVIKIRRLASLENLDPHTLMFRTDLSTASLIYEGLVRFGTTPDKIDPCLAESWTFADGGLRLIFQLRPHVFFHDNPCFPDGEGRPMTADDVVYSFHRLANGATKSPNYYLLADKIVGIDDYHAGIADSISGIRKLGPLKFEIQLTKALVSFPKLLATSIGHILPREAVELYGVNIGKNPVGTGPFRLVQWQHLEGLTLARHETYWGRSADGQALPYLDGIEIRLISNPVRFVAEFLKGDLDLLTLMKDRYDQLEQEGLSAESYSVFVAPDYSIRFFGFAMDQPLWKDGDPNVRRAIAMAVDRSSINTAKKEPDLIAQSLVPGFFFPDTEYSWHPYDLNLARQTIQKTLFRPEKAVTISANIETKSVELLAEAIRKVGLEPDIQIQQVGYYRRVFQDRPDIFRVSFQPSYPDAEDYYALFYSQNSLDTNVTGYGDAEFDRLFEQALVEKDSETRCGLFQRMEAILKRDVPALYLCHPPNTYHVLPNIIHGFSIRFNNPDFTRVWIEPTDTANEPQE